MTLNKGQQRQVEQIKAMHYLGSYAAAAASLSGEIRMARKQSQKNELIDLAVSLGLHTHPKFIIMTIVEVQYA